MNHTVGCYLYASLLGYVQENGVLRYQYNHIKEFGRVKLRWFRNASYLLNKTACLQCRGSSGLKCAIVK